MSLLTKLIVTIISLAVLVLLIRLAVGQLSESRQATALTTSDNGIRTLGDCPSTPNCQCSLASREEQRVAAIPFTKPSSTIITELAAVIAHDKRVRIITQDEHYLHATYSTPLIGYIDDVEFLVNESDNTLEVRSASRLGRSDFGANAKRLTQLRSQLSSVL